MEDAIETAYASADNSDDVLKIFVAPEFYWRGPEGAYDAMGLLQAGGEFNAISEICERLTTVVSAEKFKNYIFVFGTIIAATPKSLKEGESEKEEEVRRCEERSDELAVQYFVTRQEAK
ncbi:hypothetical protein TL16_g02737 [Triparma laevis f. inornata]|uniref:Uncharacterized protein n=1 Tax=Triparma laevis f. inornata TaxID=1714386 RepID=A0A9W6ZVY4_9STRA|nr:hypothetical protein TL16_g02737 [Triparma laevis f. inornata]